MKVKKLINTIGIKTKKYSPEILTGIGVVSFVATVIFACKQTTKAHEILEEHNTAMEEIKEAIELSESGKLMDNMGNSYKYEVEDIKADKFRAYSHTVVGFIKLYSVPFILGTISLTSFLAANRILKARYIGAVAAYNAVSEAFKRYRDRVIAEGGEVLDRHYMLGSDTDTIKVTKVDENGKKTTEKVPVENIPYTAKSIYGRFFDESCNDWDKSPELNMMTLQGMESIANTMLQTRGHLFLNEVYDMIGFERTPAGAVVGWVVGNGDNYVDFGLYNKEDRDVRRFVNGVENVIFLDFNVDGVIYDKI